MSIFFCFRHRAGQLCRHQPLEAISSAVGLADFFAVNGSLHGGFGAARRLANAPAPLLINGHSERDG